MGAADKVWAQDGPSATAAIRPFNDIPIVDGRWETVTEWPSILTRRLDGRSTMPWPELAERYGPIWRRRFPTDLRHRYGEWATYIIGPEANRFVFQTAREHLSHERGWRPYIWPLFEPGLLDMDDPEHARDRRMMNPAFAAAYMNRYLPIMQRVIAVHSTNWLERVEVDLFEECRRITFDVAASALVGLSDPASVRELQDLFYELLKGGQGQEHLSEEEWIAQFSPARRRLDDLILTAIEERKRAPTDDILGLLVAARDDGGHPFTNQQLLGQVQILLAAGHETTTTLAAWTLYLLAENAPVQGAVHDELDEALDAGAPVTLETLKSTKLLSWVVNESGRLRAPVAIAPRGVKQDIAFEGYLIPKDMYLFLCIAGGHMLPRVFPDPARFDPWRFAPRADSVANAPYALATFGGGPRICIGVNFAQVEIKALVAAVLRDRRLEVMADRPATHMFLGNNAQTDGGTWVRVHAR